MQSYVVCLCCRKGKYKYQEMKDYEEKSIMHGISGNYATNNNGIGNCKTLVAQ